MPLYRGVLNVKIAAFYKAEWQRAHVEADADFADVRLPLSLCRVVSVQPIRTWAAEVRSELSVNNSL